MKNSEAILVTPKQFEIQECPVPEPKEHEILMKVEYVGMCGSDIHGFEFGPFIPPKDPNQKIGLGHEVAGEVVGIGSKVTKFKVGDKVLIEPGVPDDTCEYCRTGRYNICPGVDFMATQPNYKGALTQYMTHPEEWTYHIPEGMSYKQAALLEPLACALYGTEMTNFDLGDYVCVNGCGPIGLMFVRMCVLRGAHVIACDMTPERLALAKKLGAQEIINIKDLNGKDQAEAVKELTPDARGVDAAIEAAGLPEVWQIALRMARPGGEVLFFGGTKKGLEVPVDTTLVHYSQLTLKGVFHTTPQHVNAAFEMLKMGAISAEDFVQNEYCIEDTEKAIVEHASGKVIKNCIVYK